MKITSRILSIPPYLSTTWKNISSLHVKQQRGLYTLVVILQNRVQVEVPGLRKEILDEIFEAHAASADEESALKKNILEGFSLSLPMDGEEGGGLANLQSAMQHSSEQANLPAMPADILEKITAIAKTFGMDDSAFNQPEPNCNCVYCQVARAFHGQEAIEEEVSDEDLRFRDDWDIKQSGDQLYIVTNALDQAESYNVFLGDPIGCTCGKKDCDHIKAVLKT